MPELKHATPVPMLVSAKKRSPEWWTAFATATTAPTFVSQRLGLFRGSPGRTSNWPARNCELAFKHVRHAAKPAKNMGQTWNTAGCVQRHVAGAEKRAKHYW